MASHQGQLGRLAVCAYLAALAAALAGCSASEVVQNLTPATAIDLPQPNYRRVVADNVRAVIPNVGSVGDLEISGVRLVDSPQGSGLAHLSQGRRARKTSELCLVHSGRQDYRLAHRYRHRSMLQTDIRALRLVGTSRREKGRPLIWSLRFRSCARSRTKMARHR